MDDRRGELGLTWDEVAERANVSPETLRRNADDPTRMRTTTRKGIERSLRWGAGSIEAILNGRRPIDNQPESEPEPEQTRADRIAELEATAERLEAMARDLRRQLEELDEPRGV
ncbi:hypothetical protein [Saccharomonospora sp. CUA-673]|uniref:hypothetical protein n=1 Tax=Saccharomonospora sp. CUA-673 TaxID=1904969 RepID=UPI00111525C2|nr:hypothetical protein [Saccharomonospora sp. CUA-673]